MLICPACHMALADAQSVEVACSCGLVYPRLSSGGLDFLQGREFPDFHLVPEDTSQQNLLEQEGAGVAWRVESFVIPLLGRYGRTARKPDGTMKVLDCGCGNGLSVDILNAHGIAAFGIDAGQARHRQWDARVFRNRLHSANALHLPFAAGSFDAVLSSGLVEHIGIHEEESRGYRARRLQDCHAQRQQFVSELVRVVKHDGFILIDHPNGGCPADFWHGGKPGSIRWHMLWGDMLPRFREISSYMRSADPALRLYSLSPGHRLRFQQVRNHWYGRMFAPAVQRWLQFMELPGLSYLARSFLNPYLVTLATRDRDISHWVRPRKEET